jgi:hypothetical protein
MPVVFAKLGRFGRLGNILHQAAATIALARRNNDSFLFPDFWEQRIHFNIPEEHFAAKVTYSSSFKHLDCHYRPIPYQPNLNLEGYFQSELYWNDLSDQIIPMLTPKLSHPRREDCASIHVRRGDYLASHRVGCYTILGLDYYERAMEIAGTKAFLVFSDDIEWCKRHFPGNQFEFSEGNPPHADLALMMSCAHHIIANSSFSWWGARLNWNPAKRVIAPKTWHGEQRAHRPTADMLPKEWIRI